VVAQKAGGAGAGVEEEEGCEVKIVNP